MTSANQPIAAEKAPTPFVSPSTEWTRDSMVLRTIFRQCICGERHKNVDLFEHYTAPARLLGKPSVVSRLVPWTKTWLPEATPIQEITAILPLATCPACVSTLSPTASLPRLDEAEWARTVKRKAAETAGTKTAPAPSAPISIDQLDKDLGL